RAGGAPRHAATAAPAPPLPTHLLRRSDAPLTGSAHRSGSTRPMNPLLIAQSRLAGSVLHTQTDERLTELAATGSDAAFEAIVRRYRSSLIRHCRRLVGDADA